MRLTQKAAMHPISNKRHPTTMSGVIQWEELFDFDANDDEFEPD